MVRIFVKEMTNLRMYGSIRRRHRNVPTVYTGCVR